MVTGTRSTNRMVVYREEIEAMYRAGRSGIRIAEWMKSEHGIEITPRSVQRQLNNWDMEVRGVGRPDNGLNLFEEIRDEYDAYWLGFLMGDSCVSENGNAIILGIIDREHVEKLKEHYKIPSEIKIKEKSKENSHWRDMHYIQICSQRSVANAGKWGLVHDKRKRFIPELPTKLMRHFWRGLWDADGHINDRVACLTGKEQFMRGFRKWIGVEGKGNDGYCGGIYFVKNTTWRTTYTTAYAQMVVEKLYKDCTISLNRKKLVADKVIAGNYLFNKKVKWLSKQLRKSIEATFEPLENIETETIISVNP